MKTKVNGNILEGAALKAYTAKAAKADKERQRRNFNRSEKRVRPDSWSWASTTEYVREYFRVNKHFVPCTYIINGRKVIA